MKKVPVPWQKWIRWTPCVRWFLTNFPHWRQGPLYRFWTAWPSMSTPTNVARASIPSGSFLINSSAHLFSTGAIYFIIHFSNSFLFSFGVLFSSGGLLAMMRSPFSLKYSNSCCALLENLIFSTAMFLIAFFKFSGVVGIISSFIHSKNSSICWSISLPFSMSKPWIVPASMLLSRTRPQDIISLNWAITPGLVKLGSNNGPLGVWMTSGLPGFFLTSSSRSLPNSMKLL